jgi:hypothetical protein
MIHKRIKKSVEGLGRDINTKLGETLGETKPGGKFWEQRKGALGKWDPGKGTLGKWVSEIYGGTFKDIMDQAQGKGGDNETTTSVPPPTLSASEVDPNAKLGALQNIRKKKQGRLAANLSPASGASILTSR